MFWSKIWFFLVALVAAVAVTVALVLPRPAERAHRAEEHQRLTVACNVVGILLADNARIRVQLASTFSRAPRLIGKLDEASRADSFDATLSRDVREVATQLVEAVEGQRPDFALVVDRRGRAVARVKVDEDQFGDVTAGRPLIDDALAGYLRDDLWVIGGRLYLVAAAPVIKTDGSPGYVGAIVLGHAVSSALAEQLVASLGVGVSFFVGAEALASWPTVTLDRTVLERARAGLTGDKLGGDCAAQTPVDLSSGRDAYTAVVARMPGEAQREGAFYSIYITRPKALGFTGTLGAVSKDDLSLSSFPWPLVGGAFVLALALGLGLMVLESDRPLRRLNADAVKLAKGEKERLGEDEHRGKFGSVARSVNIHVDKIARDAKSAKKDLDQLLGPAPDGALGALDLLASAPSRPMVPPPPPSEFKFSDPAIKPPPAPAPVEFTLPPLPGKATAAAPPPVKPARPPVPGGVRPTPPPVAPPPPPPAKSLDDDILSPPVRPAASEALGGDGPTSIGPADELLALTDEEATFRDVFDQFIALKKECGEPTGGLTFDKFADKLRKNRDDLRAKTGCREVRFSVYVKEGKAALKASPVKV
ncbi:MAG: hypothetical protein KBG28_28745 [Kofleriaceae bacterium]|nr:hypothetical protein [Kofleriaceae bacterium]